MIDKARAGGAPGAGARRVVTLCIGGGQGIALALEMLG